MEHPLSEKASSEESYDDFHSSSTSRPAGIRFSSSAASQSVSTSTVKKECLSIRVEDEVRIVNSLASAAKKQATGSVFSIKVDISKTGTLGIGVKDLAESTLTVSLLKRENELAGLRLGDVIFGVNFIPTREGSRTLIKVLQRESREYKKPSPNKELASNGNGEKKIITRNMSRRKYLYIQAWRCHQLCSDAIPGHSFPRADDVLVQAYSLVRTKVFNDWERWNFVEIILSYMLDELKSRVSGAQEQQPQSDIVAGFFVYTILTVEGRWRRETAAHQRLGEEHFTGQLKDDVVSYVLRVEDVESGLQWIVHRRYRDFFSLHEELSDLCPVTRNIEFPKKKIIIRKTAKLVENRILRKTLHLLTQHVTVDCSASRALRHLQVFLGLDKYVDAVHPPPMDDQRYIEFLNDFNSPACQQCIRFGCLTYMKDALSEVELFVTQQHQEQMMSRLAQRQPNLTSEQLRSFTRKCIRRQVEAALYLPLRRILFRIVYSYLAVSSKAMQRAMMLLQQATPKFFQIDSYVERSKTLPGIVKAFRRVIQAYLPADQGQLLIDAAASVAELHNECREYRGSSEGVQPIPPPRSIHSSGPNRTISTVDTTQKRRMSDFFLHAQPQTSPKGSLREDEGMVRSPDAAPLNLTIGDIYKDFSVNFSLPTVSNPISANPVTSTEKENILRIKRDNEVDLIGQATLADPVGVIFRSEETAPTIAIKPIV
eukprot:gene22404-29010_t